ncbi:MAG TPA: ABC transporter ATP-binding protein [Candidatus Limnocylindrales bacterium]|nr:ABC transporter ATP-binding protein [Candidatus Limnocylindrales bacterium]
MNPPTGPAGPAAARLEAAAGRLIANDVRVSFPGAGRGAPPTVALDGFSIDVAPGEVVAIIGPNGCGKSTFLRVAAGLLAPDSGEVTVDRDAIRVPDRRVGLVFQEPRLLPWRSVAANIAWPLELAGIPRADARVRVDAMLHTVGLTSAADLRPVQLSGGMRQRAAIARTLALAPEVLLLDEPFSALDALTRERFNLELLKLQERTGTTVVIVTHSIPEAILLADRVFVMTPRPGRVAGELRVDAPRPRSLATLDGAIASSTAASIRALLQDGEAAA